MSLAAGTTISSKYVLIKKLGRGGFGEVWLARHTRRPDLRLAIKLEQTSVFPPQLRLEANVYIALAHAAQRRGFQSALGFPRVRYFGEWRRHNVLVMDLLGESVEDVRKAHDGRLPLAAVCAIGDQVITRLETLHTCGYLHRDIKPDNLLFGRLPEERLVLHLVDMGLSKQYMTAHGEHILERTGGETFGTPRYLSVACHDGRTTSRRDDLESVMYMLVYLAKGKLPWDNLSLKHLGKHVSREERLHAKLDAIRDVKARLKASEVCEGLPDAFAQALHYTRRLGFKQKPDYSLLRRLLRAACLQAVHQAEYTDALTTLLSPSSAS